MQELTYVTEEFYPLNYTRDGRITGLYPEVLRLIWKQAAVPEQHIISVPWARGVNMLENRTDVVLFAAGWTIERARRFQFVLPVSWTICEVVTMRSYNGPPITTMADLESVEVGAIRQDLTEQVAIEKGLSSRKIHQFADQEDMLRALTGGALDAILVARGPFEGLLHEKQLSRSFFTTPYVYFAAEAGFMFNKGCPQHLVKAFQKALDKVRTTSQYARLLKRFNQHP